mmetsp:Transcript_44166/g.103294  ORF Transcript_44166/g.103294 Transcript_44166/m.103294 type:complete len:256 (-) Transcript_44166:237-1004(-)
MCADERDYWRLYGAMRPRARPRPRWPSRGGGPPARECIAERCAPPPRRRPRRVRRIALPLRLPRAPRRPLVGAHRRALRLGASLVQPCRRARQVGAAHHFREGGVAALHQRIRLSCGVLLLRPLLCSQLELAKPLVELLPRHLLDLMVGELLRAPLLRLFELLRHPLPPPSILVALRVPARKQALLQPRPRLVALLPSPLLLAVRLATPARRMRLGRLARHGRRQSLRQRAVRELLVDLVDVLPQRVALRAHLVD